MSRTLFVDTGAWLALSDRRDQYHPIATQNYRRLRADYRLWATTNLVISESYALIRYRGGHRSAMQFLQTVWRNDKILKIHATPNLDEQAVQILQHYHDQAFSFVDAVSFTVMRQHEITDVFAFDHHFAVMGFQLPVQSGRIQR